MPARKKEDSLTPEPANRRRSSRISLSDQKNKYVEDDDSEIDDLADGETSGGRKRTTVSSTAKPRNGASRAVDDGGDSDADAYQEDEEDEEDEDDEEEDGDEEETKSANNKRKRSNQADSDSDGDGGSAPRRTFIPHKKLRDLGGVSYFDDTVHPVSMAFLKDLKANNRREWLKDNDAEFRRAQQDWLTYVETLSTRLAAEADDTLPELPAKDLIFRIYRDVRFSKNPQPYKPYFAASWSRTGKKGPYALYYVHCEPGNCLVGGGHWYPDNEAIRVLRASIDEHPHRWHRALVEDTRLRDTFFPTAAPKKGKKGRKTSDKGAADDEGAAAKKAFAELNAEGALKKKPLGYSADHRDIELLKLRNFFAHKKLPDSIFTDRDGQDKMVETVQALVPFVTFLNRIVRPDPGDDFDSDEEDEEAVGDDDEEDVEIEDAEEGEDEGENDEDEDD
ncbi:hypothetical protein SEPCBS119000_001466 [Sporothrix epigloea]|uniref:TIGR02453 family protein n=1 Tax=Sporothrix epigloea TaxID=1892477 RepID=A0ABP0DCD7_9PEZI